MTPTFHTLAAAPDSTYPGGGAEIRFLINNPRGDLTHAVCPAGQVAPVHHLPELHEAYYILAGHGEIWRSWDGKEGITALRPGRWVHMPPGTRFQFRAYQDTALVFLVVVLPSWEPELFHTVPGGPWPLSGPATPPTAPEGLVDSWMSGDLRVAPDCLAPDGSEIRLLFATEQGSLALCTLHAGDCSSPVRHRSVHEIWFVLEGHGELWRETIADGSSVTPLWPGASVDIPTGARFQFRATGLSPLRFIMLTMPHWPGHDEAQPATPGQWPVRSHGPANNLLLRGDRLPKTAVAD
jgi:mannose-6-phosphate isomerase-like protein (cupin superfamily)